MRDSMQLLRRLAAVCAAALSLYAMAEPTAGEGVPNDRPLKVLMIGNSFSLSNFRQMPKVAAAMGRRLDLASIHIGGCSLERHWNNVLAASTNATFRPYKLDRDVEGRRTARDVMVNMPDALVLDKWDVVTIQQASSLSWRSETYQPFGDLLVAKIREFAPQAKIVVQETWSYPPWDKRLANFGFGPEEMYRRLHDAYGAFAKKHGFDVVPVGAAAERFPNRESLFTKPDFHFNRDGEYLQGLVFTAKLFGADVRKCAYKPDWMDASRAEEMKSVAMAAIEGQRRFMPVDFKFSCDKPGGVYSIGEKALITVEAIETNGAPAENGVVKWKLNNFGDEEFSSGRFDLSCGTNAFTVAGAMSEPGFMRLDVCFERAEGTHGATKYFGVAYNPYEIKPGAECPADFNEFWREAVRKFDEAVTAPIKMTKVTDDPPVDRDLYELEIPTIGGRSIWGYLSEPKDLSKGPFPVIVHVPGAGPSQWGVWGDDNCICVLLNVNDYRPERRADGKLGRSPRNLELHEVQNGEWSARYPVKNKRYHQTGIASSREDYFYYGVLLAMNRAVDWIAARPEVDRSRFRYNGTSQGGGFGLWLCGLNSNFTRATVYVPALTDLLGFRCGGRESGWPRLVEGQLDENRAAAEANAPYFCGVNFARNIKIPIRVNVGSADTVCPPMAGFSAFNVMPSKDKEIIIGLGQGHDVFKDIRSRLDKWLADDFKSSQTNKHRSAEVVAFPDAPF